jgi:TonB family protein
MMRLRHDLRYTLQPSLAILCVAVTVCAQDYAAARESPQVITGHRQLAALELDHPAPEYPAVAKVNYLEGPVQIEITVDNHGSVSSAHVLKGNPVLAAAALNTVSHWVFRPLATTTGPAGFKTTVRFKFSLRRQRTQLMPPQAELDFQRQVKPPQISIRTKSAQPAEVVRMRLLVNDQGQVVDTDADRLDRAHLKAAFENMRGWTFHPAHWGTLPIASYVIVDVPLGSPPADWAAASPDPR